MAFVKVLVPEAARPLKVAEILRRLRKEFAVVESDKVQGWDHVDEMIAATLRFSQAIPERQEQLDWLRTVQDEAVYVAFGDSADMVASCCLMPGSELFFSSPDEIHGPLRALVDRCAAALGYDVLEG